MTLPEQLGWINGAGHEMTWKDYCATSLTFEMTRGHHGRPYDVWSPRRLDPHPRGV
jgi:hypothetical protein